MPNPLSLNITSRAQIHIGREAQLEQRVTFESPDTAFRIEVPALMGSGKGNNKYVIHLEPAVWTVTHEFRGHGEYSVWALGKGKKASETILTFDDGLEGQGDGDYWDIVVRVFYNYNPPGGYRPKKVEILKGNPDLTYKPLA